MSVVRRILLVVVGGILGGTMVFVPYVRRVHSIEERAQVLVNQQIVVVDVARTENDRAVGLSSKTELGVNEGMLFTFPVPGTYGFWMKDMRFPIDIVWIRQHKVVAVTERIAPPAPGTPERDLPIYYPPEEVDQVLEVAAGRARLARISVGTPIAARPFVPRVK